MPRVLIFRFSISIFNIISLFTQLYNFNNPEKGEKVEGGAEAADEGRAKEACLLCSKLSLQNIDIVI